MFLLLALGTTALCLWGVRGPFAVGWRGLARPLMADCVDRRAAEIGSPLDIGRAQAMARRLPLSVRIDGPVVNGSSRAALRPTRHCGRPRRFNHDNHRDGADERWDSLRSRGTADGHHIRFGAGDWGWDDQPTWLAQVCHLAVQSSMKSTA